MVQSRLPCVIILQELMKLLANHGAAAAGWSHDKIVWLEDLDESLRQFLRFGMKAVIEKRLPAAGLGVGEVHLAAEALQDLGHRHADMRVELVRQTGNKQCDVVRHRGLC